MAEEALNDEDQDEPGLSEVPSARRTCVDGNIC
jgi:hypothetical protein